MALVLAARFEADGSSMSRAAREARAEIERLAPATRATGAAARAAAGDIDRMERETGQAARETDRLTREQASLASALTSARRLIAGLGIGLFAREVVSAGLDFRSTQALFRTATGDAEAGAAALAKAGEIAERLGLRLEVAERGFGKILAAARGTALENQARSIFEGVATAAAALQLPAEDVNGVLSAIQQIISKGTVSAEELRGQLGERLPGAFQIAARAIGVTTSELGKMLENGELLSEDFLPAFAKALKTEFGDAARDAAQGATADFNRFRNDILQIERDFAAGGFLDGLSEGLREVSAVLREPETRAAIREFGQTLGDGLAFAARNADTLVTIGQALILLRIGDSLVTWAATSRLFAGALAVVTGNLTAAAAAAGLLRAGLAFLGGPTGIAVSAVLGGIALLATRTDAAAEALSRAEAAGDEMRAALDLAERATRDMAGASGDAVGDLNALRDAQLAAADAARERARAELAPLLARQNEAVESARQRFDAFRPSDPDEPSARFRDSFTGAEADLVDELVRRRTTLDALRDLDRQQARGEALRAGTVAPAPDPDPVEPTTPNSRKKKGSGSASKTDVVAELDDELAALRRLAEARAIGSEAIREELILREQQAALGRAGLTLADLEGGANQLRAQRIAELSRAISEEQAAVEAAEEVNRAFGDAVGQSFEEARAAILAWRTQTLADLAAAGDATEDMAAKVEEVVRARLADAYRTDLDRRTDWEAGVERGLDEVAGLHETMAERAESAVRAAFSGMEDAFVSLATTGKIQTQDLVEFALRQLFRLASQSAISLAGGGSGGLLGGLFSGVLGLFGGGAGATSGTGPFDFTLANARGNVFNNGRVLPFASGGLVTGPTLFPMADGATGLMGEAGPEAILPLTRLGSGRLGVDASGAGRVNVVVNVIGGRDEPSAVNSRQDGDTTIIDVLFEQIETRLGDRARRGRGELVGGIAERFELRPKGGL